MKNYTLSSEIIDSRGSHYFFLRMTDDPDEICTGTPVRSSPRFCGIPQGDDSFKYFLFIESKVMFHTTSFGKAALFWFALHYIFNLQYCKQAKEVATFFKNLLWVYLKSLKGKVELI